jgi:hypothetical protein
VQRRLSGTRIALLISLLLHLTVLLSLRDVTLHKRIYKRADTVHVDLMDLLSSTIKPPPRTPKRTIEPIKRARISPAEASPGRISSDKSRPRPTLTQITNENITDVPMVDTNIPLRQSLPSPLSSTSSAVAGASSQGKGTGKGSGSSRGGRGFAGTLVSVPSHRVSVKDSSISEKFQIYTEADLSFVRALQEIAQHVLTTRNSRKVDIVFVVDTSESMQDDIDAVRRHLGKMIDRFQKVDLDFTLGVVRFHHSLVYEWLGMDITISPQTSNVEGIREILRSMKVSGGERALDALMEAISKVKFRSGADRHFILVTDEYVKGTYPVSEVLRAAKRAKISIDVLGRDEPFQRTIAEQTGGIWTPIEEVEGRN